MASDVRVDPEVHTSRGDVRGIRRGDGCAWLGIPYAAPPVGHLRFRPPEPPTGWIGTRPADTVGPAALQTGGKFAPLAGLGPSLGEDCLYLNVYAPADPGEQLRPVVVWIHGGAFRSGSGALYDGTRLAALGDIVVVTINYRMGVFGFVDLADTVSADPEAGLASNLGLRDQIAALQWVHDEITSFGGDPARVTVAGESAGSISTALLTCAPAAQGLFRAAIMESGSYTLIHGDEVRHEVAQRYAGELKVGRGDAERLRTLPAQQLLDAQTAVAAAVHNTLPAAPWFDGDVVPGSLAEAQAAPRPDLALLAGHTHDEVTLFQLPPHIMPATRADLSARLRAGLPGVPGELVIEQYPADLRGTRSLGTDFNFAMPTRHFAQRHAAAGGTAYFYRFDAGVPLLGATHAAELPYLWGWSGVAALMLRGLPTPAREALATRFRRHWVTFVREGRPGPDWDPFTLPHRTTKIFDPGGDRLLDDPDRDRRIAWDGADVMPRA